MSGLIVAPIAADQSYLQPWLNHIAMVFIDRQPNKLAAASVVYDDIAGATAAIGHLIEHGHRRIAFVGDSLNVASTARRMRGYETTLLDSGVAVDFSLVMFGADTSSVVPGLLALSEPPSAIFSANPSCSVPVSRQLHAAGRTDIPLVSFGDFPLADILNPPVSAIDQDPSELGRIAAERLFQRIDNPDKRLRRQTIVPVTLTPRGCCERPHHTGRTTSHAGSPGAS